MRDMLDLMGILLTAALTIAFVIGVPAIGLGYYSSCRSAVVYNALHGSHYSCGDFFWAESQINQSSTTVHVDGRLR